MIRNLSRCVARRFAVAALAISASGMIGCDRESGAGQADAVAKKRGNVFAFVNRGDVITQDLNRMSYLQDFRIAYALREGLYKPNPQSLVPEPCLAAETKISDDKKTWTFTLRDDGKWTNGDAVTSKDFLFSWRSLLESPGQYSYLLNYIKGAKSYSEAYVAGTAASFDDVGIKAPDDHTLIVTLDNPVPFLPDLMTFPTFYPRNERSMEKFKSKDPKGRLIYDEAYTQAGNVVTNGPYTLEEWSPGKQIVLKKSEVYRAKDKIKLDGIKMVVNLDPQSAKVQYDNGEVDWLADVSAEIGFGAKQEGRKDLKVSDAFGTAFLTINCKDDVPELKGKKNPLVDMRVRQALAMAIDKQQIVDAITRMGEKPADRYVPAHFYKNWNSKVVPGFDTEAAKKLLADAGYPNGQGFPQLAISYNSDNQTRKDIAEYLHHQWQEKLGINIELQAMESKGLSQYVQQKQYTIAFASWYGDYQDPSTWTDKYKPFSENNDSAWKSPAYSDLVDKAAVEPDETKRQQLLVDAEGIINGEVPIIPLYYYVNFTLVRDDVHGLSLNQRNTTIWDDVSLERPK